MLPEITTAVAATLLVAATYTDLKWREVPDWINYAGIAAGLGIRLIYSMGTNTPRIFTDGLLGFAVFLVLAFLMYYLGQWGGGDSKLLMALGTILGVDLRLDGVMISFLFNLILFGGIYGLLYCTGLAFKNRKTFKEAYGPIWHDRKYSQLRKISYVASIALLATTFAITEPLMKLALAIVAIAGVFTAHAVIFIKAVENCCMYQRISPNKLTEGDWIAEDVILKGRCIVSHKTNGITKEQINELIQLQNQGKIRKITVKMGIPFVPGFLIAFIATKTIGNVLLSLAVL